MITLLRAKRNRPYLSTLVFVLLVCWISLAVSATCTMPITSALMEMPEHMPGCPEEGAGKQSPKPIKDCTLKPCLDSQTNSLPDFNRLAKPDLPVLILGLISTFFTLCIIYLPIRVPRNNFPPPTGRRVLLIYRFCTLLN